MRGRSPKQSRGEGRHAGLFRSAMCRSLAIPAVEARLALPDGGPIPVRGRSSSSTTPAAPHPETYSCILEYAILPPSPPTTNLPPT
ncbi:MAG: hypothetical protein LBT00_06635 [Spirochaetaceae bacterium]|nr:hypothetical protein [Spirochaetaceae bacterium]